VARFQETPPDLFSSSHSSVLTHKMSPALFKRRTIEARDHTHSLDRERHSAFHSITDINYPPAHLLSRFFIHLSRPHTEWAHTRTHATSTNTTDLTDVSSLYQIPSCTGSNTHIRPNLYTGLLYRNRPHSSANGPVHLDLFVHLYYISQLQMTLGRTGRVSCRDTHYIARGIEYVCWCVDYPA